MNFIGYWDTRKATLSLGKCLIFLKELELIAQNKKFEYFSVVIHGEHQSIYEIFKLSKYFFSLELISKKDIFSKTLMKDTTYVYEAHKLNESSFEESTLFLQDQIKLNNFCISSGWKIPLDIQNSINNMINKTDKVITIHIKNIEGTLSNSNLLNWQMLIKYILKKDDNNKIFIIGNDLEVSQYSLFDFKNVTITKSLKGKNILLDLSLILSSNIFLGMSSGPCNVAIFSDIPYVIFKQPNHHTEEMKKEMNEGGKFIFQKQNQHFLLEYDTFEALKTYFDLIDKIGTNNE